MEKKKNILLLIMLGFLILGKVELVKAEESCTTSELATYRDAASRVKATYITKDDYIDFVGHPNQEGNEVQTATQKFVYIKIYNLDKTLGIKTSYSGYGVSQSLPSFLTSDYADEDGAIVIRQAALSFTNVDYSFEIFSNTDTCGGRALRTVRITVPRYNFYSSAIACEDIPEYYLCQEFVTHDIDGETFNEKIVKYKEKKSTNKELAGDKDNTVIGSRVISTMGKYKYLVVGFVVAVGVVATILIIKRKKSDL